MVPPCFAATPPRGGDPQASEDAMPSISTLFRATIMIATAFCVVKGWQMYGPTTEQVKALASTALAKAQAALQEQGLAADPAAPTTDASPLAVQPPLVPPNSLATAGPQAPQLVPLQQGLADPSAETPSVTQTIPLGPMELAATSDAATAPIPPSADAVAASLTRLHELGGTDAELNSWGTTGELYRCSCRAKLEQSSLIAHHFEAVAQEPAAAVEQVVAKLEAWRAGHQGIFR